ncbi:hypothetical protein NIIDMKKI_21100 [Mycobacterium kansasii]|uniref:Uncharacterized protein n=1 Tax=Mycobacterium kansasii TaxID=1768 RepID=A0A7G1I900_MYCKA|nr:hypothetical protein NIIDMKKI_21100 [Mycobacterium kansasii]
MPLTVSGLTPRNSYRMVGAIWYQVWPVHMIEYTSSVPRPRAAVLYAPAAQVWESLHASTSPGRASPFSAMT